MSFRVIPREKKSRVLKLGTFGCLRGAYAINVTQGCGLSCTYCYARGYANAPPKGDVHLFVNLPQSLRRELDSNRRRRIPAMVAFNTATDCFQPHPEILGVTYQAMTVLLERGIGISFLTKGFIPQRFIELFKGYREKVQAQIGVASLSEDYRKTYEPGVASAREKLENIERLLLAGIDTQVRIDPIIPFVTDTGEKVEALFGALGQRGIRTVSLSYLHLRPAIQRQLKAELPPLHRKLLESCFHSQNWIEVGLSTKTKLLPKRLRENGYRRIKTIAQGHGISAVICRCKNPDLKGEICAPARERETTPGPVQEKKQLILFPC
jgi:DNA repair photolyase